MAPARAMRAMRCAAILLSGSFSAGLLRPRSQRHLRAPARRRAAAIEPAPTLAAEDIAAADDGPMAVILLNLGGPETSADVEPFLRPSARKL